MFTKRSLFLYSRNIIEGVVLKIMNGDYEKTRDERLIEKQDYFMSTIVTQKIYGHNSLEAYNNVLVEIQELENLMSFFKDSSDVSILNRMAGKGVVKLSKKTIDVLACAKDHENICRGAFDITIAPIIDLWRRCGRLSKIPGQKEVEETLKCVDCRSLHVDRINNMASLAHEGQLVDLGGIAKGYAADIAVEIYAGMGIKSAIVDLGGNVFCVGNKPDGNPWTVGIQRPYAARGVSIAVLQVTNKTIVTSGDYERFIKVNGKNYHHIIDPRTGYPADSNLESATVICENSMKADILSTAAFVLGLNEGMEVIGKVNDVEAILVTKDKEVFITKGLRDCFHCLDSGNDYKYYIY
ncbi:FAD:protein FMN transferase [Acetivibrio cellulolyticus]